MHVVFFDRLREGFTVRHLWLAHDAFNAEFGAHAIEGHFKVQLAHAAQNRLAGFAIRFKPQRRIGANHLAKRCAELLEFGLVLGLHRHTDHRFWEAHALQYDLCRGVTQRVAGIGLGERDECHNVACARFFDGIRFFREHFHHAANLLSLAASGVRDGHAFGEHAGIHANKGQRAVGIVDDLEREGRERLIIRANALAHWVAIRIDGLDGRDVSWGWQVVDHRVEYLLHALVLVRRTAQDDSEGGCNRALAQAGAQGFYRRLGAFQIGFHRHVVHFQTGVDQFRTELGDVGEDGTIARHFNTQIIGDGWGDIEDLPLSVLVIRFPNQGLHLDQVDHALEVVFGTNRQVDRQWARAKALLDHVHTTQEVCAATIHLVDVAHARHFVVVRETPVGL